MRLKLYSNSIYSVDLITGPDDNWWQHKLIVWWGLDRGYTICANVISISYDWRDLLNETWPSTLSFYYIIHKREFGRIDVVLVSKSLSFDIQIYIFLEIYLKDSSGYDKNHTSIYICKTKQIKPLCKGGKSLYGSRTILIATCSDTWTIIKGWSIG